MFPYLPQRPGYNKRLRSALLLVNRMIRELATDSDFWFDNHWIVDSTPVPCGMSRPTVQRSNLAGWAGYGYCASHSRFFWGLRLYLVCTPTGMPILWAPANPKIGEREAPAAMLEVDANLIAEREGILLISDKGFASKPFERALAEQGIELLRPSRTPCSATASPTNPAGRTTPESPRPLDESHRDTPRRRTVRSPGGGRTGPPVQWSRTWRACELPLSRSAPAGVHTTTSATRAPNSSGR
ncbi:transposase [Streptosporangium amethystogenes]|uniref:transposase n=1 Tax=Streptosporangium amethystogenes TaxID=2002 RepID=UPI0037A3EB1E